MAQGRYEGKALEDLRSELQELYLGSERGMRVLAFHLLELGMFDEVQGEAANALRNYATRILRIMGVYEAWNIRALVRKYAELPRSDPKAPKKQSGDMLKEAK